MINLLTINELFEYSDKILNIKHISSELNKDSGSALTTKHKIIIKNIEMNHYDD